MRWRDFIKTFADDDIKNMMKENMKKTLKLMSK